MAHLAIVPNMGLAIKEATLSQWLKEEGQKVEKDEVIATIVTDKITMEITAPESGVLLKKMYKEQAVVPINKPIAVIGQEGEDISAILQEAELPLEAEDTKQPASSGQQPGTQSASPTGKKRVSPLARRLAKEHGVDLELVKGSGPGGAVRKEDILNFAQEKQDREPDREPEPGRTASEAELEELMPFIGARKAIAEHMVRSKQTAPHVTTVAEVDMTEVLSLRKKLLQLEDLPVSLVTFIVKAALAGIKDFPVINSTLQENQILIKKYVNMGIAVAGKDGLIVPVIARADKKSFLEIAREIETITAEAREGSLALEKLQGGTFTISNAGAFGAVIATPIINQPQSAILWAGRIAKKPEVYQDEIAIRSMMYLALSYDHRVMDGAIAAQYLQKVRKLLENPQLTLLS